MKKWIFAVFFVLLGGLLISCVTPGSVRADSTSQLPSIAQKYEERFQKTQIGMGIDSFILLWPEARPVGENAGVSAYEVRDSQLYYTSHDRDIGCLWTGSIKTHEYIQAVWFYFSGGKLIKWGTDKNQPVSP